MTRHFDSGKYGPKYTIGDIIKPYGKVAAILWLGERYYLCIASDKSIAMIPAIGLPFQENKNV